MTFKNILYCCMALILAACANPKPFEEAKLQADKIYMFKNQTSNYSLYLKFLPPEDDNQALLFKTVLNSESVGSLRIGDPGVYHQKSFEVNNRGKVRFLVTEPGLYEELLPKHQYSHYGSQRDEMTIFRYQLDMRRAFIAQ